MSRESEAPEGPVPRKEIEPRFRWNLDHIFSDWDEWKEACREFEERVARFGELRGSLGDGPENLLRALRLADRMGELSYKIWYYPSLTYDLDQRDNAANARRQRVQALFARWHQASSWVEPELLQIPRKEVESWLAESEDLELYRFKILDVFRRREHVLEDGEEKILSFANRLGDAPDEAFSALSTADARFPEVTLSDGRTVTVTYGQYRALLATRRKQEDRRKVFRSFYEVFERTLNTYAALYNGVCQRDWFLAKSRRYDSTLERALDDEAIPPEVLRRLVETTREGVEPLRRYHRLRRRALDLETYHLYDTSIPLVEEEIRISWDEARETVLASLEPLGSGYRDRVEEAFDERWIDVWESPGKRSGAYSAGVYGVHPYVLLNYNRTLDDLFTVAHELGHTVHSILSHESQPFVYASYSIFVAEVASTLSEALLLDHLLERAEDRSRRIALLQHAIDGILGTFYTQVLFAEWELEAHRMVERGEPLTADSLSELYRGILQHYYGDTIGLDEPYRFTWARIPHFFHSPYYVYQYATSHAASSRLFADLRESPTENARREIVDRYLELLKSGGNDYPVELLRRAGVDLTEPEPVEAVIDRLDRLVDELEELLESPQ